MQDHPIRDDDSRVTVCNAFSINAPQDAPFAPARVHRLLVADPGIAVDPTTPASYVFAGEGARSRQVAAARVADPDKPHWVVFIDVAPERIYVYREATSDVLDAFAPLLIRLLRELAYTSITDEEGRVIADSGPDAIAAILLS
jgi:hypothetical protein